MSEEKILLDTFQNIRENLDNPEYVNNELFRVMERNETNEDILLHTMSPASLIKENLPLWSEFMKYVSKVFLSNHDEETALDFMGAAHEDKLYY